jgi:hypothetical protein
MYLAIKVNFKLCKLLLKYSESYKKVNIIQRKRKLKIAQHFRNL